MGFGNICVCHVDPGYCFASAASHERVANARLSGRSRSACRTVSRCAARDVIPFWLRHGLDREHGGIFTALDRDGIAARHGQERLVPGPRRLDVRDALQHRGAARGVARGGAVVRRVFAAALPFAPEGKMYFTVTREGRPLRMRRYVFSEAFAAIANAAFAKADGRSAGGGGCGEGVRDLSALQLRAGSDAAEIRADAPDERHRRAHDRHRHRAGTARESRRRQRLRADVHASGSTRASPRSSAIFSSRSTRR